jgi:orotidine-5'-phosphate decarboxylase
MGADSIKPFLEHKDKWTIILGLTSNSGARDFELQKIVREKEILEEGIHITRRDINFLYETVLQTTSQWGSVENTMYVVGATRPEEFVNIRKITPNHFYLVPGVGAQGGSLKDISQKAMIKDCGLLVNASRAIIYASNAEDFADEASIIAQRYADEMSIYLG